MRQYHTASHYRPRLLRQCLPILLALPTFHDTALNTSLRPAVEFMAVPALLHWLASRACVFLFPHLPHPCFRVLIYWSPNIYIPESLHRQPLFLWTAPRVHMVETTVRVLRHKHSFPSPSRALHLLPDFVSRCFSNNTDYITHFFTAPFDKCHFAWRVPLGGRGLAPRLSIFLLE